MNSHSGSRPLLAPQRSTLRALSPALALIAGSGLLFLLQPSVFIAVLPLALACVLILCLWRRPSLYFRGLDQLNAGAQGVAAWLGVVISFCVYLVVITPVALLLRMLGRDLLAIRSNGAKSNWHPPYRQSYDDDFFKAQH